MPQNIKCSRCEKILYDGKDLESPLEIMSKFDGICPKCNKKLHFDVENVEIIPMNNDKKSIE